MNREMFSSGGKCPPPFMIVSAERSTMTAEINAQRTSELRGLLCANGNALEFYQVTGSYQNVEEQSFLVPVTGLDSYLAMQILRTAYRYGQDTVMYVDQTGAAFIIPAARHGHAPAFPAADWSIGKWHTVPAVKAFLRDGWTMDSEGNYYATA